MIKGDVPVNISWSFNNIPLAATERTTVVRLSQKVSTLSIDGADASHIGLYTCVAKNGAGSDSSSTYLHVNGR